MAMPRLAAFLAVASGTALVGWSGNSGWDSTWSGCSWVEPGSGGGDPTPPAGNLAAGRPVTATSTVQSYVASNSVDGNANSYWESANNTWPQSLTVDLGTNQRSTAPEPRSGRPDPAQSSRSGRHHAGRIHREALALIY